MSVLNTLVGVILTSLVFITIVGNVLVCLSVVLVRKLRKPQNYLLVSLAVSDLFVSLFVMPFAIVFEVNEARWPLSNGLCDLYVSADVLSCTASILNLCAISVDRYQAITRPLEYSGVSSPRRMLAVIFAVWLSAACVSLPPVLLLGNEHAKENCTVSQNFWYQIYATMASFYVPLCVMVVVYAKILRVVADKKKQMTWTNNSRNSSVDRTAMHVDMHYLQERTEGVLSIPSASQNNHNCQLNPSYRTLSDGSASAGTEHFPHPEQIQRDSCDCQRGHQQTRFDLASPSEDQSNGHSFRSLQKFRPVVRLKDHKASTTLGIIMSAFIICWLPFFVLAIIRPFMNNDRIPGWVSSLFLWLGYFNSSLNPVIYVTTNRDFRRPFREILCFRCSTLDDLMRREFYDHQYGGDEYCVRNKKKLPTVPVVSPLSPTSETNMLANNKINKNSTSDSVGASGQPESQTHSPSPLRAENSTSSNSNGQDIPRDRPPWTSNTVCNRTFETQLTTDPETDADGDGENVTWSTI